MTKIVTFYSYKGGVGRTMALVNTAHILARDGYRVLMVDFDLEAPGMTHFFADVVRERPQTVEYDAVDLLLNAKRSLLESESPNHGVGVPQSLAQYVVSIRLLDSWLEKGDEEIPYRNGRLDLLPATLEPIEADEPPVSEQTHDYLRRMDELDLTGVFAKDGPRHRFGDHVRKYFLNARFKATGDVLFTMRDRIEAAYDIVLIDSRTGLNEISGLCIGPLCDALVVCSGLNRQNVFGTRYFMEKAGLLDREKAKPYIVMAGPVPPWHSTQSETQVDLLKKELRVDDVVRIPYHPAAAISETVFVTQEPKEPISKAYGELAPEVAGLVDEDSNRRMGRELERFFFEGFPEKEFSWSMFSDKIAKQLNLNRLKSRERGLPPLGFFASFPSACTVASLPTKMPPGIDWRNAHAISVAAAVSAYRLKSDRPFRRAWKLINRLEGNEEQVATDCGVRMVFFQLRVLGSVPSADVCQNALRSGLNMAREEKESRLHRFSTTVMFDSLVTAFQLQGYNTNWDVHVETEKDRSRLEKIWENSDFRPEPSRLTRHWFRLSEGKPESYLDVILDMLRAPAKQNRDAIARLIKNAEMNISLKELSSERFPFSREFFHPMMMEEMMWERQHRERPEPLGLWIEPLMACATAFSKGASALDEILGWLTLSKFQYGYAWRVLVDWRYLEPVKNHPAFVAFLRKEDEEVEKIESAIDRGEYPL